MTREWWNRQYACCVAMHIDVLACVYTHLHICVRHRSIEWEKKRNRHRDCDLGYMSQTSVGWSYISQSAVSHSKFTRSHWWSGNLKPCLYRAYNMTQLFEIELCTFELLTSVNYQNWIFAVKEFRTKTPLSENTCLLENCHKKMNCVQFQMFIIQQNANYEN